MFRTPSPSTLKSSRYKNDPTIFFLSLSLSVRAFVMAGLQCVYEVSKEHGDLGICTCLLGTHCVNALQGIQFSFSHI